MDKPPQLNNESIINTSQMNTPTKGDPKLQAATAGPSGSINLSRHAVNKITLEDPKIPGSLPNGPAAASSSHHRNPFNVLLQSHHESNKTRNFNQQQQEEQEEMTVPTAQGLHLN